MRAGPSVSPIRPPRPAIKVEAPTFLGAAEHPKTWRDVRSLVLLRDGNACQQCGTVFDPADLDVHHLVPRSQMGSDEPSNLITLCDGCHASRHIGLQVGLSRRFLERWAIRMARLADRNNELPDQLSGLAQALRVLGKTRLRDGQLDVILAALSDKSMIVVRPTGSGKSLCFQIPALLRPGTAIVVTPLKALMSDQVAGLQELKVPATFINSSIGPDEKRGRYELAEQGVFKFLFVAPERFNEVMVNPREVERLRRLRPSYLIVDEAHCVDRWGTSFRPDYSKIGEIREALGWPTVLAFTATASSAAQSRILESLRAPDAPRFVMSGNRPNIILLRKTVDAKPEARATAIAPLLSALADGKAMIFVPTKKEGTALQDALAAHGLELPFYHSKAETASWRDTILNRFAGRLDPPLRAVICTNAFGMGLDISDVRLVVHTQHPSSVEDYLQEFGRAGRDGKPALAVLLRGQSRRDDVGLLEYMCRKTFEAPTVPMEVRGKALNERMAEIKLMNEIARSASCFRADLSSALDEQSSSRRSVGRRILDWVFAERQRVHSAPVCCDSCHPVAAAQLLSGQLSV